MPSIKGDVPTGSQIALPQAPKLDRYGLHAYECECQRCAMGYRPTAGQRDAARWAFERAERAKAEAAKRAAEGDGAKKGSKAKARADAFKADERYTDQLIAKMNQPVLRPATPEELAELRREFPFIERRRKPR